METKKDAPFQMDLSPEWRNVQVNKLKRDSVIRKFSYPSLTLRTLDISVRP